MVQSTIVYGVNLFTMPGMQRVVYAKSLKVLAAKIVPNSPEATLQ